MKILVILFNYNEIDIVNINNLNDNNVDNNLMKMILIIYQSFGLAN